MVPRWREAVTAALAAGVGAVARRSLAPVRGRHRVPGLAGEVEVAFDEHLVPHVTARSAADALAAQGFCHGLHRFFQMDMTRRVLRGRLAAVVGERTLGAAAMPPFRAAATTVDADRFMRSLDLVPAARRYLERGDVEGRSLLDAYVRGVDAAIAVLRRRRPLEHRLLRLPLRRWSPLDTVLIAKGMALGLSFKWRTAPVLSAMAERLAARPEHLEAILPGPPGAGDLAQVRRVHEGIGQALAFLPVPAPATGSNAFLVGAGRARRGAPLLASDPHLELSLPSIWYLASLRAPGYEAVGCSVPGLPGVVIGRTPRLAWGLTNGMIDDADLWRETLDGTGTRYRLDGRWRPLAIETQEIGRRGAAPLLMRLRRTHRGPLLSDAFPDGAGPAFSLRMTLHEPTPDLETFLAIARAKDGDEVDAVARDFGAPAQNLLWADATGRAGMRLMGRVPRRPGAATHPGFLRDGTRTAEDWQGHRPAASLPATRLGPDDVLVSANQPQVAGGDTAALSHLYEPDYRARRIHALLAGRDDLAMDDLRAVQLDAVDPMASWLRDEVVAPHAEAVRRVRPSLGPAIDRLLAWDGREDVEARGAAVAHLLYHHLVRRTFGGVLGEGLLERWMGLVNLVDAPLRRAFTSATSPWAPPEVRASLLRAALEDVLQDLDRRGLDVDARWGAMHTLRLRHPLGSAPLLGEVFDRGPIPVDGGPYCVVSGQYLHTRPGPVVVGASYRQRVDLADLEGTSRMITFGGQEGNVASPHYDDLTPLWRAGEDLPMRLEAPPSGRRVRAWSLEP